MIADGVGLERKLCAVRWRPSLVWEQVPRSKWKRQQALGFRAAGNSHGERARWTGAAGARLKARPGPARDWSSAGKPQHQQGQQLRPWFTIAYVRILALLLRAGSGAASCSRCLPEGQGLAGSRRRGWCHGGTGRCLPGPCAGRLLAQPPPRVHAMHAPDT